MDWDNHNGINHFFGTLPVDMDSPPKIGDRAKLTMSGFEFEVEIAFVSDEGLGGVVAVIGPQPTAKSRGSKSRRPSFVFKYANRYPVSCLIVQNNIIKVRMHELFIKGI